MHDYVCTVASIPNFLKLPEKSGYCVIIENGIVSLLPFGGRLFLYPQCKHRFIYGGCMAKYAPFGTIPIQNRKWPDAVITEAPVWVSVDLRDGNQALPVPMNIEQKVEFFKLLVKTGFKEIEVGFPSASETEYLFLRRLIEENLIPDDVRYRCFAKRASILYKKLLNVCAA